MDKNLGKEGSERDLERERERERERFNVKCQLSTDGFLPRVHLNFELGSKGRESPGLQVPIVAWGC